jgi:DNA-binding response OmpR family regulator
MDINLPGLSGLEALRILREDPVTAHIPIVALSANAMPRDIRKGLEAGFFRYLTKPINFTAFMDTLRVALEFADQGAVSRMNQDDCHGLVVPCDVIATHHTRHCGASPPPV